VAHGIDTLVQQVQASRSEAVLNRVLSDFKTQELPAIHHSILPLRQPGDPPVDLFLASPRGTAI
jgi:hypothetical protein